MKKLLAILILAPMFHVYLYSHGGDERYAENVHQWIVSQAWEYLKYSKPNINWNATYMSSHIGDWQQGDADEPWQENYMVVGAYREDFEDPMFEHNSPTPTVTHFWNADIGDNWQFCPEPSPPFSQCYPNAYQKAYKYINGGQRIFFQHYASDNYYGPIKGRYY